MDSYDGRGLKLPLVLDRGRDYVFVLRWQTALGGLTGWSGWRAQITCAGNANIVLPVDATQQASGFVLININASNVATCAPHETWGLAVDDPNGRNASMLYGSVMFTVPVVPHD